MSPHGDAQQQKPRLTWPAWLSAIIRYIHPPHWYRYQNQYSHPPRWIILVVTHGRSTQTGTRSPQPDEEANPPPPPYREFDPSARPTANTSNKQCTHPTPRSPLSAALHEQPTTPDMQQKLRHSRLSSLLGSRDSPRSYVSEREGSESSNFSALVFGIKRTPSTPRGGMNLGETSIAKLTSGLADGGLDSR